MTRNNSNSVNRSDAIMIYVFLDISKKQEFIFKSNKLKQNIYNSYLIRTLTEYNKNYNNEDISLFKSAVEFGGRSYFCGGGNSILEIDNVQKADAFMKSYSRKVLEYYPDIELYMSKLEMDNETSAEIKKKLVIECDKLKEKRKSRFRKISFGIEKLDQETGYPLQNQRQTKDKMKKARKALEEILYAKDISREDRLKVRLTYELEDYKKEESSYIGIICLDGNRMGELVRDIEDKNNIAKLGQEIEKIYTGAIQEYVRKTIGIKQKDDRDMYMTPVITAGDDVCIITEASEAINAAKEIISNIERLSMEDEDLQKLYKDNTTLKACAGVVIVKAGYPFFDAYKQAEKACEDAKGSSKQVLEDISLIDWKIIEGANIPENNPEDKLKKNEKYHIKPLAITEREYIITEDKNHCIMSYAKFQDIISKIRGNIEISSSLLKEIQYLIYSGEHSYETQLKNSSKTTNSLFGAMDEEIQMSEGYQVNIKNGILEYKEDKIYLLNDIIGSLKYFK
jgi:hypothetical protein